MGDWFKCVDADYIDDGEEVLAATAEIAARNYAEDRYPRIGFPNEQTILVTAVGGEESRFTVRAEPETIRFRTSQVRSNKI